MNDLSKKLSAVLWADADLCSIHIDYDDFVLEVEESSGLKRSIRCGGFIGFEVIGVWDEAIIDSAVLLENDKFTDRCVNEIQRRLGKNTPASGNADRNLKNPITMRITLIDNCIINVAFNELLID